MENVKTEETEKLLKNLFGKLKKDSNSLFYLVEKISWNLLNKVRKSVNEKDKVFYKIYNEIESCALFSMKKTKKCFFARRLLSKKMVLIDR